jgi:hypothetical protein
MPSVALNPPYSGNAHVTIDTSTVTGYDLNLRCFDSTTTFRFIWNILGVSPLIYNKDFYRFPYMSNIMLDIEDCFGFPLT